jgi:hypothetical protein
VDVEVLVGVAEPPDVGAGEVLAGGLVGDDLVAGPRVEEPEGRVQEVLGPGVALVLREVAAPAEVLTGERVPGGDDVPGGPARRQVVRLANCRATSYGSLKVELIVPASPSRSVTAASAASTVKVSGRPTTSRS